MSPLTVLLYTCALAAAVHGAAFKEVRLGGAVVDQTAAMFAPVPTGLGVQRSDLEEEIVGGEDAKLGQFPHQASMQVTMPGSWWWDAAPQHLCGGTLIAQGWVLTAAHCAYGVPNNARKVEVVLGIDNLAREASGKQRILVTKMLVHAQYQHNVNGGVGPYDIALLKLAQPARLTANIKLAVLPSAGALASGDAVLSGWGSTSQDGDHPVYPNQLQTATFPIVEYNACNAFVSNLDGPENNPLADTNLCVGPLDRTGLSSCSGDSGGPLVQQDANGQAVVIGVVSWGLKNCGSVPFPSVFTRTSAYVDWIQAVQQQNAGVAATAL